MNQGNNQADDSSNATGTEPSGISSILGIGEMFASISRNKAELTGHSASITRSVREDSSARDKQKIKLQATRSIREKFDVPYHFASTLLGESETTDGTTKTDHVHQFMTTSAKATEFKRQCFEYDMGNIILVPTLANANAAHPSNRWDFTKRRNFLDHHAQITMEECKHWTSDCILYDNTGFEAEDTEWILSFARNSCTSQLRQKIDEKFDVFEPEFKGGLTYLKLMFDVIVFVNDSVIISLQSHLKLLGEKGLGMFEGESVQRYRMSALATATRLDEAGRLPDDAIEDILKGLTKCSHEEFSKTFDTFMTFRDSGILAAGLLTGTTLEQIKTVLDEADRHFNVYNVKNEWNCSPANEVYQGYSCFNCGGDHGLNHCTERKDQERISQAKAEYDRSRRGGNGRSNKQSNDSMYHTFAESGDFDKPVDSTDFVRQIDGDIYCACKMCGWISGDNMHTTGFHYEAERDADFCLPVSHPAFHRFEEFVDVDDDDIDDDDDDDYSYESWEDGDMVEMDNSDANAASEGVQSEERNESVNFAGLAAMVDKFEKETEDHNEAAFAGVFAKMLNMMVKE